MSDLMRLSREWFIHQRTLRLLETYLMYQLAPPAGYRVSLSLPGKWKHV